MGVSHTIAEVAKKTNLSSRTLRVWEEEGLLESLRENSGMRTYTETVFEQLERIQVLKELGLSLKQIREVLNGSEKANLTELFEEKCAELEKAQMQVLRTRKMLERAKTLLELSNLGDSLAARSSTYLTTDIFPPAHSVVKHSCDRLVFEKGSSFTTEARDYLNQEILETDPETTLTWISSLNRLKLQAERFKVPLRFVRGAGPGCMLPYLCGWTRQNPVHEGLTPRIPGQHWKDLHFDVPFSCSPAFFDAVIALNSEQSEFKFTPFRLPLLDILSQFFKTDARLEVEVVSDEVVVAELQKGNCEGVFEFDNAGHNMVHKLYPDVPEAERSLKNLVADLMRYCPQSRADVFRFWATRRSKTWPLFEKLRDKESTTEEACRLSALVSQASMQRVGQDFGGAVFFHEDLVSALQSLTKKSWAACQYLRAQAGHGALSEIQRQEIRMCGGEASLAYLEKWAPLTFAKSHLVYCWQLVQLCMSAKLLDSARWAEARANWEIANGLAWNDFGIATENLKILTPV